MSELMDKLVASSDATFGQNGSELEHHGIRGMKWGRRKGEGPTAVVKQAGHGGIATLNIKPGSKDHRAAVKALNKAARTPLSNESKKKFDAVDARYPDNKRLQSDKAYQTKYVLEMRKVMAEHFQKNVPKGLLADIGTVKKDPTSRGIVIIGNKAGIDQTFKDFGLIHTDETPQAVVLKLVEAKDESGRILSMSIGEELTHGDEDDVFLVHHGIRGMKWGVRRAAGSNGLVGTAGHVSKGVAAAKKVHTSTLKTRHHSDEAKQAHEIAKKVQKHGVHSLSNDELKALTARFDLEQKYSKMKETQSTKKHKKKKAVSSFIFDIGKTTIADVAKSHAKARVLSKYPVPKAP